MTTQVVNSIEQMRMENQKFIRDSKITASNIMRSLANINQRRTKEILVREKVRWKGFLISSILVNSSKGDGVFQVIANSPYAEEIEENLSRGEYKDLTPELIAWIKTKVQPSNPGKASYFLRRGTIPVGRGTDAKSIYSGKNRDGVKFMERGFNYATDDKVVSSVVDSNLAMLGAGIVLIE